MLSEIQRQLEQTCACHEILPPASFSYANSATALLSHVNVFLKDKRLTNDLRVEIEATVKLLYEQTHGEWISQDEFGNCPLASEFESALSLAILKYADTRILLDINQKIISYLQRHKETLLVALGQNIQYALNRYQIPYEPEHNIIDTLCALLDRSYESVTEKKRVQTITETFTLHLLFFNYQHVYQPELDCDNKLERLSIIDRRKRIHRAVRPKEAGQLFHETTRGRQTVFSQVRSNDFGIMGAQLTPPLYQDFHRYRYTPHKYRVKANEASKLVQHFKKMRVPYIAGPSGTAADCIEGLSFLYPTMCSQEWLDYLNLMAASECGLGHHSLHEIMLSAAHAGVLDVWHYQDEILPLWQRVVKEGAYELFLSDVFKQSQAYQDLRAQYPQYFIAHPMLQKQRQQDEDERHLIKRQRAIRTDQASRAFHQAQFWQGVEAAEPDKAIAKVGPLFVKARSKDNLARLKAELKGLSIVEKRFLRLFMAQDFELTHYTNLPDVISKDGRLLSNHNLHALQQIIDDNSTGDIETLNNGRYIFFRMELNHQHQSHSRFGRAQFILHGRHSGLLKCGLVSLCDMFNPEEISIISHLKYRQSSVRRSMDYRLGKITVCYNQDVKNRLDINLADTLFYGADILEGVALCMIRELRRIGGDMRDDFYQYFRKETVDIQSHAYTQLQQKMNWMLSRLFRLEARLPGATYLNNVDYALYQGDKVKAALKQDDVFTLRRLVKKSGLKSIAFNLHKGNMSLLEYALFNGHGHCAIWLLKQGCELSGEALADLINDHPYFIARMSIVQLHDLIQLIPDFELSIKNKEGQTLAHLAAQNNRLDLIDDLANMGVDITVADDHGLQYQHYLPLEKMVKEKGVQILDDLIGRGFDLIHYRDQHRACLLFYACKHLNIELIIRLVQLGLNINAIKNNRAYCVDRLVGSLMKSKYADTITAKRFQTLVQYVPALRQLSDKQIRRLMSYAQEYQLYHLCFFIIKAYPALTEAENLKEKLLTVLIQKNQLSTIKTLIELYGDEIKCDYLVEFVSNKSQVQYSFLQWAAIQGRLAILNYLLALPSFVQANEQNDELILLHVGCINLLERLNQGDNKKEIADKLSALFQALQQYPHIEFDKPVQYIRVADKAIKKISLARMLNAKMPFWLNHQYLPMILSLGDGLHFIKRNYSAIVNLCWHNKDAHALLFLTSQDNVNVGLKDYTQEHITNLIWYCYQHDKPMFAQMVSDYLPWLLRHASVVKSHADGIKALFLQTLIDICQQNDFADGAETQTRLIKEKFSTIKRLTTLMAADDDIDAARFVHKLDNRTLGGFTMVDESGRDILFNACLEGKKNVIRVLLDKGYSLDVQIGHRPKPRMVLIQYLCKRIAQWQAEDKEEDFSDFFNLLPELSPSDIGADNQSVIMTVLLHKRWSLLKALGVSHLHYIKKDLFSQALKCAKEGDLEGLKPLIDYIDINQVDSADDTLLTWAAYRAHEHVVNFLLSRPGIDARHPNHYGMDYLDCYAQWCVKRLSKDFNTSTVKQVLALIERVPDINVLVGYRCNDKSMWFKDSILGHLISQFDVILANGWWPTIQKIVPDLKEHVATINQYTFPTAMRLVKAGNLHTLKAVIDYVDVNTTNQQGNTLLLTAAFCGYLDMVFYLAAKKDCDRQHANQNGFDYIEALAHFCVESLEHEEPEIETILTILETYPGIKLSQGYRQYDVSMRFEDSILANIIDNVALLNQAANRARLSKIIMQHPIPQFSLKQYLERLAHQGEAEKLDLVLSVISPPQDIASEDISPKLKLACILRFIKEGQLKEARRLLDVCEEELTGQVGNAPIATLRRLARANQFSLLLSLLKLNPDWLCAPLGAETKFIDWLTSIDEFKTLLKQMRLVGIYPEDKRAFFYQVICPMWQGQSGFDSQEALTQYLQRQRQAMRPLFFSRKQIISESPKILIEDYSPWCA